MRTLSGAVAVLAILLTSSAVRAGSDAAGKGSTAPAPAASSAKRPQAPAAPVPAPAAGSSSGSQATASQTGTTTTGETLEEIVARVRRRLASEQSRTVKPPAPKRTPAAAPEPPRERVTLVWRPSLVWPSSLTGEEQPGAEDERVTLSWGAEPIE